jgi:hypothetical protein
LRQQGSQLGCQCSAGSHPKGTYYSSEYLSRLFIDDALARTKQDGP